MRNVQIVKQDAFFDTERCNYFRDWHKQANLTGTTTAGETAATIKLCMKMNELLQYSPF